MIRHRVTTFTAYERERRRPHGRSVIVDDYVIELYSDGKKFNKGIEKELTIIRSALTFILESRVGSINNIYFSEICHHTIDGESYEYAIRNVINEIKLSSEDTYNTLRGIISEIQDIEFMRVNFD